MMRRKVFLVLFLLLGLAMAGCHEGGDMVNNFGDFGDFSPGSNDELWRSCQRGNIYDVFCAGFGEDPCPPGWILVPFLSLPATCCRDATGNVFWTDLGQCESQWTPVEDGCFNHQPLCNR